jgi:hypothetical protein
VQRRKVKCPVSVMDHPNSTASLFLFSALKRRLPRGSPPTDLSFSKNSLPHV